MEALQAENEKLKAQVSRLLETNNRQVQRLVEQELLQIRIRELETQLAEAKAAE